MSASEREAADAQQAKCTSSEARRVYWLTAVAFAISTTIQILWPVAPPP